MAQFGWKDLLSSLLKHKQGTFSSEGSHNGHRRMKYIIKLEHIITLKILLRICLHLEN